MPKAVKCMQFDVATRICSSTRGLWKLQVGASQKQNKCLLTFFKVLLAQTCCKYSSCSNRWHVLASIFTSKMHYVIYILYLWISLILGLVQSRFLQNFTFKPIFYLVEFCARSGILLCFAHISSAWKHTDNKKFRSARKIPPGEKQQPLKSS